jgi:ABC-2 type transport system permease protein
VWARHDLYYTDADVAAFVRAGGAPAAEAAMQRVMAAGTKRFESPEPLFSFVPTPRAITMASPARLAAVLPAMIDQKRPVGREKLDYAVYIPSDLGVGHLPVTVWAGGAPSGALTAVLQDELTRRMRAGFLQGQGVSASAASAANRIAPSIAFRTPAPGQGQNRVLIRSVLPMLTSYMLLMSLMLSGSWMLQGTVEERSNKLMETLLACVSPAELMHGKLIGTVAVGLTMVCFWVACAIVAAFASQGLIADFLRPALAPLAQPGIALAMIFFFVAGYLMISMVFLAIGAMSDSMRDAQAYLTPVMLVIALPSTIIAQAVLRDPSSLGVRVISWIPIYTPFTMLARMGAGVPAWEVVGTGVMLALFVAVEAVLLGRVFRATLLSAGARPGPAQIISMMRGGDTA